MRTCPNCGKDTSAEMTSPCTKCGFSPVEGAEIGTTNYGGGAPTDVGEAGPTTKRRRGGIGTALVVLLVMGGFAFEAISGALEDGNVDIGEIFEPDPGPTATEAEDALTNYGEQIGLADVQASCPESAKETEVGDTFTCTITVPSAGTRSVTVTNHENDFEWNGKPFTELAQAG